MQGWWLWADKLVDLWEFTWLKHCLQKGRREGEKMLRHGEGLTGPSEDSN